jgi:hypothetical protein
MSRRLTVALAALTACLALSPAAASAAPSFSFTELTRTPSAVHANDERVDYAITVKNVGDASTSGTTSVAVDLPAGAKFGWGTGSGWSCHVSASTCTSTAAVAANTPFNPLTVSVWLDPEQVPSTVNPLFTAFGGGAPGDAVVQDSFALLPAKPFEIVSMAAVACSLPSAPDAGICGADYGSGEFTAAGGHPHAASASALLPTRTISSVPGARAVEDLRDVVTELPAGFTGNLKAVPSVCTFSEVDSEICPASAAVGGVWVRILAGDPTGYAPLYRIVPEDGYAAAFAFNPVIFTGSATYVVRAKLRANGDYGVTGFSPLPPQGPSIVELRRATLCSFGVKATASNGGGFQGCKLPGEPGANPIPFIVNPTRCADAPVTTLRVDSYDNPGALNDEKFPDLSDPDWKSASVTSPQNQGCAAITEGWTGAQEPSFTFQPDSDRAAAAAGYTAHVHVPKAGLEEPAGIANSHLKDTTVTLPEGIALNPSAADGLATCTLAQAGYLGNDFPAPNRIRFKTTAEGCPGGSKVATAMVTTPVLPDPLPGAMYLAAQDENPFKSKFAVYLVIDDPKTGIKATVPGKVTPDQATGRIVTTFADNPQAPIEDVDIEFFGGSRASLVNPDVCGGYAVAAEMTPWSAADPYAPAANEIARPGDKVEIKTAAAGKSSCPGSKSERPFGPTFEAGSHDVGAGNHTRFSLRITRGEGEQELTGVKVTSPPGLAAKLKGVDICSWSAVDAAAARSKGADEIANPSCPASSQIGTTTIGAGAGPNPFYVKTGKIYMTGPYKDAPLSFTFIVPAVAGPFDLGVQVVRTAVYVNSKNAQVTGKSDPIPQILEGVPLQIRDVRVDLDRSNFVLNPTNCEPMAVAGELSGGSGAVVNLTNRFQVGNCESLGFKPKLKLELHGSPKRAKYQRLEATVTSRPGDANIGRAAVTLPHSLFLAQEHIRTVCTRVQFAAHNCPKGSIYGRAEGTTPLLDGKVSGPVYLRSSSNELPDLVVALRGPEATPIEVELAGRTDSIHGGIRNTFDIVPDAPVSKFELELFGGQKSLIISSRNLCQGPKQRATARFTGQNGKERNFRPVVQTDCGKKKGKKNGKNGKKKAQNGKQSRVALALSDLGF